MDDDTMRMALINRAADFIATLSTPDQAWDIALADLLWDLEEMTGKKEQ